MSETIGELYDSIEPGGHTYRRSHGVTWEFTWPDLRHYHDQCLSVLVGLPCGCQDVHYDCGAVDYEHDHVECDGEVAGG